MLFESFLDDLSMNNKHQTYNKELALAIARMRMQMNNKRNVVLYLDKELVEKSRNLGFNLSKTFENQLKHLLTQFSTVSSRNNFNSTDKNSNWWAGPDLNRRPSARQADVLTELDYRPLFITLSYLMTFL